jgi:hypothetical protein
VEEPKPNGKLVDEGLLAIHTVFQDYDFLCDDAFDCYQMMVAGAHRELELPDSVIMEVYGLVTEGKAAVVTRTNSEGAGYRARIESYAELLSFLKGELEAEVVSDE